MEASTLPNHGETLMIIDDEPLMIELFKQFMSKRGYRVVTALSGAEALEAFDAENGAVDVVITDMSLPLMDGIEIAQAIAARAPNIPVLIATGHDKSIAQYGLPENVVAVIQKPYQNRVLAEQIRAILDARQPQSRSA
jgi:CheY-like chemotaxis protein